MVHGSVVTSPPPEQQPGLTSAQQQAVVDTLNMRGVSNKCPRCVPGLMTLVDNFVSFSVNPDPGAVVLGGMNVPAAILACSNCGWLDFHALGALGLLNDPRISRQGGIPR
jgi:hypothetical protein